MYSQITNKWRRNDGHGPMSTVVGSMVVESDTPRSRSGRSGRSRSSRPAKDTLSREERKEVTRRAIVAAALHLLEQDSFTALSLREVTREAGIVPAAFYRHFESMEALGLVLIDESFRSLRDMLRGARAGKLDPNHVIDSSAEILIASISERREHWRFITRERSSGVSVLRYAIRTELRLLTSELAIDLARFPGLKGWSSEDLNILASLFVNAMISVAELAEDAADQTALDEIKRTAIKQMSMITIGVRGWNSATT
ncbi:DNA-binding transcriptional regulator, AcrR family [Mycolicibacterium neoaurum]|uniref:Transcriptional regulator n=3 Tax=Mycobacteriaceae TaxID=1762 RepID=A0AAV2WQM5_MYCNE|nr:transcriptional regulator [Mycolicibacterium neoaurum]SDC83130.1 DNA-binding transcriptional regulator, AcrR family [Mycolicibacterium neoaurum]